MPSTKPEPRQTTVRVLHNTRRLAMVFGYECGDELMEVFLTSGEVGNDPIETCEEMFRVFNVGDDPTFGRVDPRAEQYRGQGLRSLSVGDVIAIGEAYFACTPTGFEPITSPTVVLADQASPPAAHPKETGCSTRSPSSAP